MMPSEAYTYLSSRLVKEVFALGGSVEAFVPTAVERRLAQKRADATGRGPRAVAGSRRPQPVVGQGTTVMLASRMSRIASSPTMKGLLAAERLRRQGMDVVDLGAGEPDFPTPEHVKAAAHAAIDANFTKYTPNAGTCELRQAICARVHRPTTASTSHESQVIVTAGGKQALANAALSLFGAGDEVITHAPGLADHPRADQAGRRDAGHRAGASPRTASRCTPTPFIDAITPRTKGFVINSPANPTGALMSEAELTKLAKAAADKGLWIVLDLCYEQLIYEPVPHNLPGVLVRELRDRCVVCGSASKALRDDRLALRLGDRAEGRRSPPAARSRAIRPRTSARSRSAPWSRR